MCHMGVVSFPHLPDVFLVATGLDDIAACSRDVNTFAVGGALGLLAMFTEGGREASRELPDSISDARRFAGTSSNAWYVVSLIAQ